MEVKTFRASSMQEALQQIRSTLGPDAAVIEAREVGSSFMRWLTGARQVEVMASADIDVPTRLPEQAPAADRFHPGPPTSALAPEPSMPSASSSPFGTDYRSRFREAILRETDDLHSLVAQLSHRPAARELPDALFHLFTDLIDAEIDEELARELVERVHENATERELDDVRQVKNRVAQAIESELRVSGPIQVPAFGTHVVALVGPTGVGKTTTIAKLAANFRLRDQRRVGLITVDTYRIAAVDQLRTYADIIDLPMEVVSTPREMREAVERLSGLELVLVDTAGRSPRDDVKIQELKSMLAEAGADEVHLVLSGVASARNLASTARQFAAVGVTALLPTKLDEASGYGNLLSVVRSSGLPLSYVTHGQNVPDDIAPADGRKLTRMMLGMERAA
ncbi:MAG: flagellar biosynthesis protein FlhF [Planctomycetes bacterium]|nr:flagellar biosynthesis protein FlhF [Planctomycetota bacterium]